MILPGNIVFYCVCAKCVEKKEIESRLKCSVGGGDGGEGEAPQVGGVVLLHAHGSLADQWASVLACCQNTLVSNNKNIVLYIL